MRVAIDLAVASTPSLAGEVPRWLAEAPSVSYDPARVATAVTNRVMGYLDAARPG